MVERKTKTVKEEKDRIETKKKVLGYKLQTEANIVSIFYKKPEELLNTNIKREEFSNNIWKVYFEIAYSIIVTEKKKTLDDITVGMYLNKHPNLSKKYDEYGGYNTIQNATEYVKVENLDGYIKELRKWNVVLKLFDAGFPVKNKLSDFADMTAEEIYSEFEAILNHTFINIDSEVKSYNAFDGIHELIDELNAGSEVGMPFYNADLLTNEIAGLKPGHIYGLGASSGCVDCDTEFFNGYEWKRIADYEEGDKVLQYNEDGTAELVTPLAYIKQPSEYLWYFKTKYGLNQCLSDEHTVVYKSGQTGCGNEGHLNKIKFKELRERHENNVCGFSGKFYTTFDYEGCGIDLTDDEIRLMISVFADGSFHKKYENKKDSKLYNEARFHIKKDRKKNRLVYLAEKAGREYRVMDSAADGYLDIYIDVPFRAKHFPKEWYMCNKHQFNVIAHEVMFWDGEYSKDNHYSTTNKNDADFIQFVFSTLGYRATISTNDRKGKGYLTNGKEYTRKSVEYTVSYTTRTMVGMASNSNKTKIEKYKTVDGYEYCFTVPSHMLVLRRGDRIFITGNCGKSTMAFNYLVPSAIEYGKQVIFIINEEDQTKFQREMIIWVANNIFKEDLQKYILRNGNFGKETMDLLMKCADWIEERKENKTLTVIPLQHYSVNIAIKIINKYSSLNPEAIFCLDTLKESCDARTDEIYKSMMRDMIALYDTVKPSSKNVALFVTYQLGKGSIKSRHLTNYDIGQAKSIVDVMSVNIMMRRPFEDEYEDGKNKIKCWKNEKVGKNSVEKSMFSLKKEDHPMIIFINKNRFGVTDQYQVVAKCDLSRNVYKDIGYCSVPQDW